MKKMGLLTIAVFILIFGISITAKAASLREMDREISEKQYLVMEEQFVNEVRMILLEKGCKNAGITLTYIIDEEGYRNYTITLHHARLDKMEVWEMALLTGRLQESAEKILLTEVLLKQL